MNNAVTRPILGALEFDADLNWYQGRLTVGGQDALLYLSLDECQDEQALLAMASEKISDAEISIRMAKEFAARELLELKNGEWLGEGESPFTEERFAEKLLLESMVFYPDRTRELTFRDGGLFFGHVVLVSLDEDDACADASIAG